MVPPDITACSSSSDMAKAAQLTRVAKPQASRPDRSTKQAGAAISGNMTCRIGRCVATAEIDVIGCAPPVGRRRRRSQPPGYSRHRWCGRRRGHAPPDPGRARKWDERSVGQEGERRGRAQGSRVKSNKKKDNQTKLIRYI